MTLKRILCNYKYSESLDLWTLAIVRNFKYLENTTFLKLDVFPSSGEGRWFPSASVLVATLMQTAEEFDTANYYRLDYWRIVEILCEFSSKHTYIFPTSLLLNLYLPLSSMFNYCIYKYLGQNVFHSILIIVPYFNMVLTKVGNLDEICSSWYVTLLHSESSCWEK
jgi:hypothetical protein